MTTQGEVRSLIRRRMIARSMSLRHISSRRRAFTFVESMIALAVMSLAGAALLTSVLAAVGSSNDSIYRSIGTGLAQQLLDEIAAAKFPSGYASTIGTMPYRNSFTTIDDYSGWTESPPRTKSCEVLGTDNGASVADAYANMMTGTTASRAVEMQAAPGFINRFTRSVLVERLQPGTNGWTVQTQNTSHRRVTVTVSYTASNQPTRTVAQVSRVFSYLPPTP